MISYANGNYIETQEVAIPIIEDYVGALRGYRIFTTGTTINHQLFRIDDHILRLFSSAKSIFMEISFTKNQLSNLIKETISKNSNIKKELTIIIFFTGGPSDYTKVKPKGAAQLYILINEYKPPPIEWYKNGISVATFIYQRQYPTVKLLSYVGAVIAHQTVIPEYNAQEGLFISPEDNDTILEGTTFSFFVVDENDSLTTPPENKLILGSITRRVIVEIIKNNNLSYKEEKLKVSQLKNKKEAFLVSANRGIVPIVRINNFKINNGYPGEKTSLITKLYKQAQLNYKYV